MKPILFALFALCFSGAIFAQSLPSGPGKDVTERVCSACHGADLMVREHMAKDDWKDTVDDMIGKGAEATDEEVQTIITYLGKFQGPFVNVNKAAAAELQRELELTAAEAEAVIKQREAAALKEWADLEKVAGLDLKKIEPVKGRIQF